MIESPVMMIWIGVLGHALDRCMMVLYVLIQRDIGYENECGFCLYNTEIRLYRFCFYGNTPCLWEAHERCMRSAFESRKRKRTIRIVDGAFVRLV